MNSWGEYPEGCFQFSPLRAPTAGEGSQQEVGTKGWAPKK
jgi:hypothetical protein